MCYFYHLSLFFDFPSLPIPVILVCGVAEGNAEVGGESNQKSKRGFISCIVFSIGNKVQSVIT